MNKYLALFSAIFFTAASAQNVQQVTVGDNQDFGITYSLPRTEICATVSALMTKTVAGPYAPFAEKYLGLTDVATSDRVAWEVTSITLQPVAVPDRQRTYHIQFPEKGALPQFYFSDAGMLLSINREPELPGTPVIDAPAEEPKKLTLKATDVLSEDILKAASKAKQAELTAREIFSLRESRRELLKGEVENMPKDGASYQLVLDNLDAQERALLSLFVGTTTEAKVEKTFRLVPTGEIDSRVFFRFSSYLGFVDEDDLVGEPYYISVKITDVKSLPDVEPDPKKKPAQGVAYNVPGWAHVALSFNEEVIAEGEMMMPQFGHVAQLPAQRFTDKKKPASAMFNPLTGSIKIYE